MTGPDSRLDCIRISTLEGCDLWPNAVFVAGDVMVLVGTRKGGFIVSSDRSRSHWRLTGPFSDTCDVFHFVYDGRGEGTLLSATNSNFWGPRIELSYDLGASWVDADQSPRMNDGSDRTVERLWNIQPGKETEPGVLFAGAQPASLFRSHDWGRSWEQWSSLTLHPTRERWEPGLSGLCLHSIVQDPVSDSRMWVGISAVGVMRTGDGGETWDPVNRGVRADFNPRDPLPEYGQCTHKMLAHASLPNRLYQQNHCGFYRSDDAGDSWLDLSDGLPSRFGMPMAVNSHEPDTVYAIPEDSGTIDNVGGAARYVTGAQMRVFRSRNGGDDWQAMTNGLPQRNAFFHIQRDGMATDELDPCGVYVGTSTGQIFYSRDAGDSWELLIEYLPPINSIEVGIAK